MTIHDDAASLRGFWRRVNDSLGCSEGLGLAIAFLVVFVATMDALKRTPASPWRLLSAAVFGVGPVVIVITKGLGLRHLWTKLGLVAALLGATASLVFVMLDNPLRSSPQQAMVFAVFGLPVLVHALVAPREDPEAGWGTLSLVALFFLMVCHGIVAVVFTLVFHLQPYSRPALLWGSTVGATIGTVVLGGWCVSRRWRMRRGANPGRRSGPPRDDTPFQLG